MSEKIGTYLARAIEGVLCRTSTGKENVAVQLEILEGPHVGKRFVWNGYLSEAAKLRTFDSLFFMGWDGKPTAQLNGITANEVEASLEQDTYEGKTTTKVAWVNKPGLSVRFPMNDQEASTLFASMAADIRESAARAGRRVPAQPQPARAQSNGYERPRQAPPPQQQEHGDIPF